jgi:hypothetical protein
MGKLLIATAMLMLVAGEKGSGGPVPPPIKPLPLPPHQCGDAFRDSDMAAAILEPSVALAHRIGGSFRCRGQPVGIIARCFSI